MTSSPPSPSHTLSDLHTLFASLRQYRKCRRLCQARFTLHFLKVSVFGVGKVVFYLPPSAMNTAVASPQGRGSQRTEAGQIRKLKDWGSLLLKEMSVLFSSVGQTHTPSLSFNLIFLRAY
ncbi:hypothetical protein L2E82_11866 [Cichorium intybus]|uniref:Uncharacterized protein n=1 Tax=Cichorium intybus TaxID=13427 RepID=A0ACB9GFI1_CICIN|nr:hypothetical protein L2E82_11866 [Cichorium intybus]